MYCRRPKEPPTTGTGLPRRGSVSSSRRATETYTEKAGRVGGDASAGQSADGDILRGRQQEDRSHHLGRLRTFPAEADRYGVIGTSTTYTIVHFYHS